MFSSIRFLFHGWQQVNGADKGLDESYAEANLETQITTSFKFGDLKKQINNSGLQIENK